MLNKFVFTTLLVVILLSAYSYAYPDIQFWYGQTQPFGHTGQPQDYVNILGNISETSNVSLLSYSLNGELNVNLSIDPNLCPRLISMGDFNIDILCDDLDDGNNFITVTAQLNDGNSIAEQVVVDYNGSNIWPLPYTADWSTASQISDIVQVVDGNWAIVDGNVRTIKPGYDRLIAIGDVTWTDYEITAPITIHSYNSGGVGFIMRWTGHTDDPTSGTQPKSGYLPLGEIAWYYRGGLEMYQYGPSKSMSIPNGIPYIYKARVETLNNGNSVYSMKVWPADANEPEGWDITSEPAVADLASGSAVIIVHKSDISVGRVDIRPLGIKNISVDVNDTNAVISWQTSLPTDINVAYGLTEYTDCVMDSNLVTSHSIELLSLTPNTLYRYMITSVDGNGIVSQSSDLMFTTTGPDISGIISDDFDAIVLDSNLWTFVNPVSDCSYDFNGMGTSDAWFRIHVPHGVDHNPYTSGNRTGRIMQDANNVNFEIEAKFESDLTLHNQIQGLAIQQDVNNWIRFDFHAKDGEVWLYTAPFIDLVPINNPLYEEITDVNLNSNGNPIWIKVKRQDNNWMQWYSHNGNDWIEVFQFQHTMTVTAVGVMAGNAGENPAFTCNVDYFFNTDSPIAPEDNASNLLPILNPIGNHNIVVDQIVDINIHAYDPCGQAVTITAEDLPGFASFNDIGDGNAVLHLEPNAPDSGIYLITVTATDPCGLFDSETITVTVEGTEPIQSGIVSDDFHTGVLNTNIWTFYNPNPPGGCNFYLTGVDTNDAWANISLPAGAEHQLFTTGLKAPHLVQSVNDVDFEVEVKFESPLITGYQEQGIIIKRDSDGFMRFEFYSNGSVTYYYVQAYEETIKTPVNAISDSLPGGTPGFMRLNRTGDIWTMSYSYDSNNWTPVQSLNYPVVVNEVGFYGGNASGATSPAHTASIDYFFNTSSPIVPEDPITIDTHTVTFVDGANGSIDGTLVQVVDHGSDCTQVTAVADSNYHFAGWTGDYVGMESSLTIQNVTFDMTITANFAIDTFTLDYAAGAGGSLTGNAAQVVNYNTDGTAITAVPNTDYHFVDWSDTSTDNPRTDTAVTANVSVTANFATDQIILFGYITEPDGNTPIEAVFVSAFESGYDTDSVVWDSMGSGDGTFRGNGGVDDYTITHSVAGKVYNALTFDGVDDHVEIPDHNDFTFTGEPFSICAWVNMTDATGFTILAKQDEWRLQCDFSDRWVLHLFDNIEGGNIYAVSDAVYTSDENSWKFITAVSDGTNTSAGIKIYVDANEITVTQDSSGSYTTQRNTSNIVKLGRSGDNVWKANGKIDNVMLFSKQLNISEIQDLYNLGSGTDDLISVNLDSNCISYWGMDDPVYDYSVSDVNGYYEIIADYNWSGKIEPDRVGWIFEPNSNDFNNVTGSISDVNYVASMMTFNISGNITEIDYITPMNDVNVSADNSGGYFTGKYGGGSDMTDVNGFYQIAVDYNWTGTVRPSRYAYSFDPNNGIEYDGVLTDFNDQDYTGAFLTYSISGHIWDPNNRPLANVSVDANNGGGFVDATDANGFYELWVDYGWSGTVAPEKQGYYFDPNEEAYTNVLTDYADVNFMGIRNEDVNIDGFVNELDLWYIIEYWLQENPPDGDIFKDNFIDFLDFARLADVWLIEEY